MKFMAYTLAPLLLLSTYTAVLAGPETLLTTANPEMDSSATTLSNLSSLIGSINTLNQALGVQIDQVIIFKENNHQGEDLEQIKRDGKETIKNLRAKIREAKALSEQLALTQHIQALDVLLPENAMNPEIEKLKAARIDITQRFNEFNSVLQAVETNMRRAGIRKKITTSKPNHTSQSELHIDINELGHIVIIDPQILPSLPEETQPAKRSWLNFWTFGLFGKNN